MHQSQNNRKDIFQDKIQAKLDKIKKDFDRSQKDIKNHPSINLLSVDIPNIGTKSNLSGVPTVIREPGGVGTQRLYQDDLNQPSFLNPGQNLHNYAALSPQVRHPVFQSVIGSEPRVKNSLANLLTSPHSPRLGYLSRLEKGESQVLQQVLDANKVPNKGRIGATGNTPTDVVKAKALSSQLSQVNIVDKYRGVVRGGGSGGATGHHKSSVLDTSGGSGLATKASNNRVFGVQQQLYKDVDSDHQQKMLHSNIYIPDYESESKFDDTNFSDHRKQAEAAEGPKAKFSTLDSGNQAYQRLYDRYQSIDVNAKKGGSYLPAINKKSAKNIVFDNHFRKRQMSVVEEIKRNIDIEMQKHQNRPNYGGSRNDDGLLNSPEGRGSAGRQSQNSSNERKSYAKNLYTRREYREQSMAQLHKQQLSGDMLSEARGAIEGGGDEIEQDPRGPKASLRTIEHRGLKPQASKAFGVRSQSLAPAGSQPQMSLQERTMAASKSKVLQMLSQSSLTHQLLSEAAPVGSIHQSQRTLPFASEKQSSAGPEPTRRKSKKPRFSKSNFESLNIGPPKVDHRNIVLEMDLIDKQALEEASKVNKNDISAMKNKDPAELEYSDKVELIRRQLVLQELGIPLPRTQMGETDVAALFEMNVSAKKEEDSEEATVFSPLKSEKPTASVVAMVKPIFPLQTTINYREDLKLDDVKSFYDEVTKYATQTAPLSKFADLQKTDYQLDLKQGIFQERLERINRLLDKRFEQAYITYCEESVLLKNFREQIRLETQVQGKPLFPAKPTMFDARWKHMKGIRTHQAVPISKSGHLMGEDYLKREIQLETLEKAMMMKAIKKKVKKMKDANSKRIMLGQQSETEEILEVDESESGSPEREPGVSRHSASKKLQSSKHLQEQMRSADLEAVKEELEDKLSQQSDEDERAGQANQRRRTLNKKLTSNIDVRSFGTAATPGEQSKVGGLASTARSGATIGQDAATNAQSIARKYGGGDADVIKVLEKIVRELFFGSGSEKVLKDNGIYLNNQQQIQLEKYHSSAQLTTGAGRKLAKKLQEELMKALTKMIQEKVAKQRLDEYLKQEKLDFLQEENKNRTLEFNLKMANYLKQKQQEYDVINYVVSKEENDSDEDFNVFDQLAQGVEEKAVDDKLKNDFHQKLQDCKDGIMSEENKKKMEYLIDPAKVDKIYNLTTERSTTKRIKYAPSPRSLEDITQRDFNRVLGSNFHDRELEVNNPVPKSKLQIGIQKQIADMTDKFKFLGSSEHLDALQKYLKYCAKMPNGGIAPLPILNKIEHNNQLKALALEDYSINMGQVICLSRVLHRFGPNAFTKVYLNNNGLNDRGMSIFFEGLLKNPFISEIEVSFNRINEEAVESLSKMFGKEKKSLKVLKLARTNTTEYEAEELFEALSQYKQLTELKLSNFKFGPEATGFVGDAINGNLGLKHLDLSWNKISSRDLSTLTSKIARNKTVNYFSLANTQQSGNYSSDETTEALKTFIRRNTSLLHLDLSYMNVSEEDALILAGAANKSRTLLALHLSGNGEWLSHPEARARLRRIMRPRKRMKDFQLNIGDPDSDEQDIPTHKTKQKMAIKSPKASKPSSPRQSPRLPHEETQMPREVQDDKLIFTRVLGHFEIPHSHRWAETTRCWVCEGHRYTLVLASKSICDQCYVKPRRDDRRLYIKKVKAVQDRHKEAFQKNTQEDWGSDNDERYYDAEAEEADQEAGNQSRIGNEQNAGPTKKTDHKKDPARPSSRFERRKQEYFRNNHICGRFSGWSCRSLIPIHRFITMLYKNTGLDPVKVIHLGKETYLEEMERIQYERVEKSNLQAKARREKTVKNLDGLKLQEKVMPWVDKINSKDTIYGRKWLDDLTSILPYKEDMNMVVEIDALNKLDVVNKDIAETQEKVYAYACFLPPGQYNSCILYNTDTTKEYQKKKGVCSLMITGGRREKPIDVKWKKVRKYKVQRKFVHENSVFRDWTYPNMKLLLETDLAKTKLKNFVKEKDAQELVFKHYHDNLHLMLDHFAYIQGKSSANYPLIGWLDVSLACQDLGLVDNKTFSLADVDRLIISVNNESKLLRRYEYFEFFVRVARLKYMENGKAKSPGDAVKMLIDRNFKQAKYRPQGGKNFREDVIWSLGVDDLFQPNAGNIHDLYRWLQDRYATATTPNPDINLAICKELGAHLDLREGQIQEAYAFCKMLHADEYAKRAEYQRVKMAEFYELLVRLAHMKFKDHTALSGQARVELAFDVLFALIGRQRAEPQQQDVQISSESDYESDE